MPDDDPMAEAREVIALALDHAAYGDEHQPPMPEDGPIATSEARDDAQIAIQALMDRPDLLAGLVSRAREES